jgi:membrane protein
MHRLSQAQQRWNEIYWETRGKLVRIWVRLDGRSRGWLGVFERTHKSFLKHQGNANAAAVAYYTLFSVFPLTLLLIALGSFFLDPQQAQEAALAAVGAILPGAVDLVQTNIQQVLESRGTAGLIGIVGFVWAASGVFGGLSRAINQAWDVERPRPPWVERALAAGMVMLIALLFGLSLLSTAAFELVTRLSSVLLGESQVSPGATVNLLSRLLPYLFTALLFSILYGILPSMRVAWAEVLPAALMAGFAWEVAKIGFAFYLSTFAVYNLVYGSLGAVIGLLVWSYLGAVIILLGAEFSVQYARRRRRKSSGIRP